MSRHYYSVTDITRVAYEQMHDDDDLVTVDRVRKQIESEIKDCRAKFIIRTSDFVNGEKNEEIYDRAMEFVRKNFWNQGWFE